MVTLRKQTDNSEPFCSEHSLKAGESMAGSAPMTLCWLLLEYEGVWESRAVDKNDLPRPAQNWLNAQRDLLHNCRVQFIKRSRQARTGITFFVALSLETEPVLYQFQLDAYEDLLMLDLRGIVRGDDLFRRHIRTEPLFLVCTNGKRDRCCARSGIALFRAMEKALGEAAWQCTHLDGHRFAPTLVSLPGGAYYGRLTASDIEPFLGSVERGEFHLENLRGRCCFDNAAQAAELFLRQETGELNLAAYSLSSQDQIGAGKWVVTFVERRSGDLVRLTVAERQPVATRLVSCSPMKSKPMPQFQLLHQQRLRGLAGGDVSDVQSAGGLIG